MSLYNILMVIEIDTSRSLATAMLMVVVVVMAVGLEIRPLVYSDTRTYDPSTREPHADFEGVISHLSFSLAQKLPSLTPFPLPLVTASGKRDFPTFVVCDSRRPTAIAVVVAFV